MSGNNAWRLGGSVNVVDVATGSITTVAEGKSAEWLDDHTLSVTP